MKTPKEIIQSAIEKFNPIKVLLLFSGGHDSLVSAHICSVILENLNIDFTVYHGDTTIGIKETQDYVKQVCTSFGWNLVIRKAPKVQDHYESIVANHGFPGATKSSHQLMYRRLKERALRHYVTHECKSSAFARENVLLLTGVRAVESRIRMGYTETTTKENSRIWCNPIFYMTNEEQKEYMRTHDLPRNPVKDKICISGECLCGSWGTNEELAEIRHYYPDAAKEIDRLDKISTEKGFPWGWGSGPNEWYKHHPKGQYELFGENEPMFMCIGCEEKRQNQIIKPL